MSTPLDPNSTFRFPLPDDIKNPEAERRAVICRYMSCREWLDFTQGYKAAMKLPEDTYTAALVAVLSKPVQSCEQFGELMDLTPATLIELCQELPAVATVSELQAKKSARQLRTSSAASAANASTAGA